MTSASGSGPEQERARRTRWLILGAVIIGAAILLLAIDDEPYHIDELRQVRVYGSPLSEVVEASFRQGQPPLDSIVNAAAQRRIGVGDARQRAISVAAGIGSLLVVAALGFRAGFGSATAATVLTLGLSPLLISVTAFARPYALPLFLILSFLLVTDVWLLDARPWTIPLVAVLALLLPLSRTVEPPILLAAAAGVVIVWKLTKRGETWRGSFLVPIAAAVAGLVLVAVPVLRRLSTELNGYTVEDSLINFSGLSRLWTELPSVLKDVFPAWPLALTIVVLTVALPDIRRSLFTQWWWWVLATVPTGFALVFFARTQASQPYFNRYTFSFWPAFALMLGALTAGFMRRWQDGNKLLALSGMGLLVAFLGASGLEVGHDLATTEGGDWAAASRLVVESTPQETVVLFDAVRPLGRYRTPFAGRPRYTGAERSLPLTLHVARSPDLVPDDAPIAVMLLGARPQVPGWVGIPADRFFTLYLPLAPRQGKAEAAETYQEFARVLGQDRGAAMSIAAAALLQDIGRTDEARDLISGLLASSNPDLANRIDRELEATGLKSG